MSEIEFDEQKIEEILKRKGIDSSLILSDWCVDCVNIVKLHSNNTTIECATGCNGLPPFDVTPDGFRIFHDSARPLKYKKDVGLYH